MKSSLPKVLHTMCGAPLLEWVLRAARGAGCEELLVVVGHGKDQVKKAFSRDNDVIWVDQDEQLGTGHAVKMAAPFLKDKSGKLLILAGDTPLIRPETLLRLAQAVDDGADAAILTSLQENPFGYGRIVRDEEGNVARIVEEADATPEQKAIKETNSSVYCFNLECLLGPLEQLKPNNQQGEYYLTDVIEILHREGGKTSPVRLDDPTEILGINSRRQLAEVAAIARAEILHRWMDEGVSVMDPSSTYVEIDVTAGRDTVIYPFVAISRGVEIGEGCTIGPFVHLPPYTIVKNGEVVQRK